jgi:hypothetical protein
MEKSLKLWLCLLLEKIAEKKVSEVRPKGLIARRADLRGRGLILAPRFDVEFQLAETHNAIRQNVE